MKKSREQKQAELVEMIYKLLFEGEGHVVSDPSSKEDTVHSHTARSAPHH